jgi:Tfp pilus assembly protein FimV
MITLAPATATSKPARRGDRTHVVAPGESLWSIAADLLGGNASSAQVGKEVERLWRSNRARIGTGDRDVLLAGTRLVLA